MSQCVAFGCKNVNKKGKKPELSFHRFPSHNSKAELRKLWTKAVRRENWEPSLYSLLCSDHFKKEDFRGNSEQRKGLKDDAVPSIFPALPKHLQNSETTKRKSPAPKKAKLEGQTHEHLPEIEHLLVSLTPIPISENGFDEDEHADQGPIYLNADHDENIENSANSTQGLVHDHGFYKVPGKC